MARRRPTVYTHTLGIINVVQKRKIDMAQRTRRVLLNKIELGLNEDHAMDFREKYKVYSETVENIILEVSESDAKYLQACYGGLQDMNE